MDKSYYQNAIWCYTERLSYMPGDTVGFRVHSPVPKCACKITRIGVEDEVVYEQDNLPCSPQDIPDDAYIDGCHWADTFEVEIPENWRSGYYRVQLFTEGSECEHFIVVQRGAKQKRGDIAFVLATNTYQAYNSWGGKSLYGSDHYFPDPDNYDAEANKGSAIVSLDRPFARSLIAQAREMRVTSLTRRGFHEGWSIPDAVNQLTESDFPHFTMWNVFSGFLNKWEHCFVVWAERKGYNIDYFVQTDLDEAPDCLNDYDVFVSVGHDEYWSWAERDAVENYTDLGGNALFMSGNACYWQVRLDHDAKQMICHKYAAHITDPVVGTEQEKYLSGMWSDPLTGRPENTMIGTSFSRGGYSNWGLQASAAPGGMTVYRPEHWCLEGTEIFYGDMFGDGAQIAGFEVDGCALTIRDGLPVPTGEDGTSTDFEIVAMAPASLGAPEATSLDNQAPLGYRDAAVVAERVFNDDSTAGRDRARRGHAVMGTFRKGAGQVFTTGTCEWAYGLSYADPYVERITANVLQRFIHS